MNTLMISREPSQPTTHSPTLPVEMPTTHDHIHRLRLLAHGHARGVVVAISYAVLDVRAVDPVATHRVPISGGVRSLVVPGMPVPPAWEHVQVVRVG